MNILKSRINKYSYYIIVNCVGSFSKYIVSIELIKFIIIFLKINLLKSKNLKFQFIN